MRSAEDLEILTTEHYATNIFNVNLYRIKVSKNNIYGIFNSIILSLYLDFFPLFFIFFFLD